MNEYVERLKADKRYQRDVCSVDIVTLKICDDPRPPLQKAPWLKSVHHQNRRPVRNGLG
jgi:hypothetical protein